MTTEWWNFFIMYFVDYDYLAEDGEIEIIMVICYNNVTGVINAHTDWIVRYAFTTDLSNKLSLVIEHLKIGSQ